MITFHEDKKQNFVEIIVSGAVTKSDFQNLMGEMKTRMDEWEHVRLLEVIQNFDGMEPAAFLEDIKFGFQNFDQVKKFEKCAVVADEKWIRALTNASKPLVSAEMKTFKTTELEAAREWLLN